MKRLGKFAALFTAIAVAFTGCNAPNESASELSAASPQTAEAVPAAETAEWETAAPETKETAETVETAPAAMSADSEKELVTYSKPDEGHVFVDFDYIENAEGITDPEQAGEWLDRALEALKETEEYRAFEEYVRSEDFDADKFAEYVDKNGNPLPRFERAYIDNFNNDGWKEAFVFITIPRKSDIPDNDPWEPRTFLLFSDYYGAEVLDSYHEIYEYSLLDYGLCIQLMVCSRGLIGNDTHSNIFGLVDRKPVKLYELRGGYKKVDCFLAAYSSQGANDFMYYDTSAHEYRAIKGKELDIDKVFGMDMTGSLDEYRNLYHVVVLIGGKYYCFNSGYLITSKPNIYEDGRFTECDNGVVISTGLIYDIDFVENIDYDAAVASMITPKQARDGYITYSQPDEGHVFVDFDYIENAEGITDPEQAGEWLDRALEALKETEEYRAFEEYVRSEDYDGLQFSEYVKDGYPVPQFRRAFIDDFDNNGTSEAFITFEFPTPYYYDEQGYGKTRYFTIYAGVNNTQICEIWSGHNFSSGISQYDIIDYGLCKQLIIYTVGLGVETTGAIFGVDNDMPENLFNLRAGYEKVDCFLSAIGWQSSGCFMYYDTAAKEYRAIQGKALDIRDVLAMDTTGSLDKFKDNGDMLPAEAVLIGGKYYVLNYEIMDIGTPFIYENGEFIEQNGCYVRNCHLKMTSVEDIDYDAAVASMLTPAQARDGYITYSQPNEGHVFVDFDYIENAEGITDPEQAGEWLDRALETLKETEEYKAFEEYVRSDKYDPEVFIDNPLPDTKYTDENGEPTYFFDRAYIDDFDRDGADEAFVFIRIITDDYNWHPRTLLIFVGDNVEIIDGYYGIYEYSVLDYGLCRQLIVCSYGTAGNDTHSCLFGVVDGKPVEYYELRGSYRKSDCFLSSFGYQCSGDFMYFDTAANEYRAVMGRSISFEEAFAMDTSGSIDEEKRNRIIGDSNPSGRVIVIGEKYYCFYSGWMDTGAPYTFENGVFTYVGGDDSPVRVSNGYSNIRVNRIEDINYDAAAASMLTPAQAALL